MQVDPCVFGVTQNQKAGIVLENFTPEPVMYFFYHFVVSLLYNMFVCVVYFWKQVMRC